MRSQMVCPWDASISAVSFYSGTAFPAKYRGALFFGDYARDCIWVMPADARQPQLLQSGAPPNWHGVIFVVKSAEMVVVTRAKMHSSGDAGGDAYASINAAGTASKMLRRR